jgi:hypothetical protein
MFKDLTPEQIALAKQESPAGWLQREIIEIWQLISDRFMGV